MADAIPPAPAPADFPPPLDLSVTMPGHPSLVRFGPMVEWRKHEADGVMKLVVSFGTATPVGVVWRTLEPDESRKLLEWMLKSVEAAGEK